MCVTCPVNCKVCYGTEALCLEKWPANGLSYAHADGSLEIPACAVTGCKVCEQTPCDECNSGNVVMVGLAVGAPTSSDLEGKRYSCISIDPTNLCPLLSPFTFKRLARVKFSRPDRPDFCLETYATAGYSSIEYAWNPGHGTSGLMGF